MALSCHVLSFLVLSCDCLVLSYDFRLLSSLVIVLSRDFLVFSCPCLVLVLSLSLSCLVFVLSALVVLSCVLLSCLVLSCRVMGFSFGNDDFKTSIKRVVPEGFSFKGFPTMFPHFSVRRD
jgi:hypothetical protein